MRDLLNIVNLMENKKMIMEEKVAVISPKQARERNMFGPVYHGTGNIDAILQNGFDVDMAENGRSNGYKLEPYGSYSSLPAPVHHLGFGVYFTTVKAIAKQYNGGTTKGLKEFWLDVPNLEEINWGSPNTMMRWWLNSGYNPPHDILQTKDYRAWMDATRNLTNTLKKDFDAVWYKGKSIRKMLDGDQVCVFDPSRIYMVDKNLAGGLEIGSKVVHNQKPCPFYKGKNEWYIDTIDNDTRFTGWRSYFRAIDWDGNEVPKDKAFPLHKIPPAGMVGQIIDISEREGYPPYYTVKWTKGGVQHNYAAEELTPKGVK